MAEKSKTTRIICCMRLERRQGLFNSINMLKLTPGLTPLFWDDRHGGLQVARFYSFYSPNGIRLITKSGCCRCATDSRIFKFVTLLQPPCDATKGRRFWLIALTPARPIHFSIRQPLQRSYACARTPVAKCDSCCGASRCCTFCSCRFFQWHHMVA